MRSLIDILDLSTDEIAEPVSYTHLISAEFFYL